MVKKLNYRLIVRELLCLNYNEKGWLTKKIHKENRIMFLHKCFLLTTFSLFLSLVASAQELLPRQSAENQKYGYVDGKGNFIIEPAFDYATRFVGDYAAIRENGRFGYIDHSGKVVVEPVYFKAGGFSEGLFRVQEDESGPWFFLDEAGERIMETGFYYAGNFHDGVAVFAEKNEDGDAHYGYVDKSGKLLVEPVYNYAYDFSDGVGKVVLDLTSEEPRYGFVGPKGEVLVPCVYSEENAQKELQLLK